MTSAPVPTGPVARFTLIRLALAVAVAFSHAASIASGRFEDEPLVGLLGLSLGNLAVVAFFAVSGFVIAGSLAKGGSLLAFALRRALRIWPALVAATILVAFVIGPTATEEVWERYWRSPDLARYIVGAVTLTGANLPLPGLFERLPSAGSVNVPLWTLKYEVGAYGLLVACVALLGRQRAFGSPLLPSAALVACLAVLVASGALAAPAPVENAGLLFSAFALGVLLFSLRARLPALPLLGVLAAGLAFAAHGTPFARAGLVLAVGCGAVALGLSRFRLLDVGERLGDCSYGVYILVFPLAQCARLMLGDAHPGAVFALGLGLTLPLAALSWRFVEKPAIGWGRQWSARLDWPAGAQRQPAEQAA